MADLVRPGGTERSVGTFRSTGRATRWDSRVAPRIRAREERRPDVSRAAGAAPGGRSHEGGSPNSSRLAESGGVTPGERGGTHAGGGRVRVEERGETSVTQKLDLLGGCVAPIRRPNPAPRRGGRRFQTAGTFGSARDRDCGPSAAPSGVEHARPSDSAGSRSRQRIGERRVEAPGRAVASATRRLSWRKPAARGRPGAPSPCRQPYQGTGAVAEREVGPKSACPPFRRRAWGPAKPRAAAASFREQAARGRGGDEGEERRERPRPRVRIFGAGG